MLTSQDFRPGAELPLLGSDHDLDELRSAVLLPNAVDGLLPNVLNASTSTASPRDVHATASDARLASIPVIAAAECSPQ